MLLAVMILPFVGLAVYILVCDGAGQREYEALLSELRAKGLPVEASDLAVPPVPDEQNAAVLYREAMDRLGEILKVAEEDTLGPPAPDHHFSVMSFTWIFQRSSTASPKSLQWFNRVLAPYTIEPSPKDVKALRAAIADCREALSLIEEGSRRPFCRFGASDEELTSYALRLAYLGTLLTGRARLRVLDAFGLGSGEARDGLGEVLALLRAFFDLPGPLPILSEHSAGHQGYSNPYALGPEGDAWVLDFRLRDFDPDTLRARESHVRDAAARCGMPTAAVEIAAQYVNMGPAMAGFPELTTWAETAAAEAGASILRDPIRGGTGVDPFLARGIGVANLGTGYFAPESEKELTSRQSIARHCLWLTYLVQAAG